MILQLTNHLLQSTLFAIAVALLVLVFRRNQAGIRYSLWLIASLKFLVPFSALIALGSQIQWPSAAHEIAAQTVSPDIVLTVEQFSQPFTVATPAVQRQTNQMPLAIATIWFCGFATIMWLRVRAWRSMTSAIRRSQPLDLGLPVEARLSSGVYEPGIVGIWRPILLLPQGIPERLTPTELQAVIAHELCHIRRRDNLFSAIHMLIEAVFWFHPMIWWIGARLLDERERACDEEVLRLGNRPDTYADAILNVCRLYTESPLPCVSGVTGADIRRRIEAIMSNRQAAGLNLPRKMLLVSAAICAVAGPLFIGFLVGIAHPRDLLAQSAEHPKTPQFEVASIKPGRPLAIAGKACFFVRCNGERLSVDGSRVDIRYISLRSLIVMAYRTEARQVSGPAWIDSPGFDIMAKIPEGVSKDKVPEMLQGLLRTRFKLSVHQESKEQSVFGLLTGKNGPKLRTSTGDDVTLPNAPSVQTLYTPQGEARWDASNGATTVVGGPLGNMRTLIAKDGARQLELSGVTMPGLAQMLTNIMDQPVIDMTNLNGKYRLAWDIPSAADPQFSMTASVLTAVDKAGLKLERRNAPVKIIVIDHLEKAPTAN